MKKNHFFDNNSIDKIKFEKLIVKKNPSPLRFPFSVLLQKIECE